MKSLQSTAFYILMSCFTVSCSVLTPEPENSCNFVQNSDKQRVSWKSNLPIKFKVHKDVPRAAIPSILEAAKSWNSVSATNVIEFEDLEAEGNPSSSYADGKPMIFWKSTWEDDKSSEQARSIIVWSGATLKDSDIWLNAKNFTFTYLDEPFHPFKVDLVSLVVHEMGHTLGLEHNSDAESVMYARLRRGYDRREIDHLEDIESFGCEYGEEMLNQENVLALVERQSEPEVEPQPPADIHVPEQPAEESEFASSSQSTTETRSQVSSGI